MVEGEILRRWTLVSGSAPDIGGKLIIILMDYLRRTGRVARIGLYNLCRGRGNTYLWCARSFMAH